MAITRRHLRNLHTDSVHEIDLARRPARQSFISWAMAPTVTRRIAAALGIAWIVAFTIAVTVEPEPTDPNAGDGIAATVTFVVLLGLLTATAALLARGRRGGLVASVAAVGVALFATVMCPVSGHHGQVGMWWFGELGSFAAVGALSLAALVPARTARA
jgi:peptidoglycan/LPS O-acetylase OafA/YrhL